MGGFPKGAPTQNALRLNQQLPFRVLFLHTHFERESPYETTPTPTLPTLEIKAQQRRRQPSLGEIAQSLQVVGRIGLDFDGDP